MLIYTFTKNITYTYLSIGDDLASGHTPFDTYNLSYTDFLYDYLKQTHSKVNLNTDYIEEDLRIKDLIKMIKEPNLTSSKNLSQEIKKADIITISIGSDELFSKLRSTYNIKNTYTKYADEMLNDLSNLLTEIRKINKKEIYIIGYYSPIKETEENKDYLESLFGYITIKFQKIEETYKVKYIKIDDAFKNNYTYLPNQNNAFPSIDGYKYIANQIIKEISS